MNVFRIRPLLGTATVILLVAGIVAEPVQAQQGTVAGQITDKSNQQPVAGAAVLISGTSLQGRTTREGRYIITKVPAGRYNVQVRLIGYATATQPVTVASGESRNERTAMKLGRYYKRQSRRQIEPKETRELRLKWLPWARLVASGAFR